MIHNSFSSIAVVVAVAAPKETPDAPAPAGAGMFGVCLGLGLGFGTGRPAGVGGVACCSVGGVVSTGERNCLKCKLHWFNE